MARDDAQNRGDLNFVVTADAIKIQDSALHRGNFLESSKESMQKVTSLDSIDSMLLPSNWLKIEQNTSLADATTFRPSNIDKTQISFFGSRRPLDQQSREAFQRVINPDLPIPRIIYAQAMQADNEANIQTIQALSDALGRTAVGDNQLTAAASRTPAFHMETARVERVNGKNVIAVDGWFSQLDDRAEIKMDANGPVKRRYSGIFFESNADQNNETKIKELYLIADDNISFVSNKAAFRTALKSIKWK